MSAPRRFNPYQTYTDSGVEWLGSIPAHWEIRRLKHIAAVRPSGVDKHTTLGEPAVRLCNYTDVYGNEKITRGMDFMSATASTDEVARFRLHAGDVVVTKDSESWEDIAVPSYVADEVDDLVCGYHLALIRAQDEHADGRYLHRAFQSRGINDQFRVAACGVTRFGLSTDALATGVFPLPPLAEQRAIADFLDLQTARLDALVATKRVDALSGRMRDAIDRLREYRIALISAAVTGQIDVRGEVS